MRETEEYEKNIKGFFHNERCFYNHAVYEHANAIYSAMRYVLGLTGLQDTALVTRKKKKRDDQPATIQKTFEIPKNVFKSENEKRLSFSLVFQTLKYQKFLQDMLVNSRFFDAHSELEDSLGCVMIILCDYQKRKFQRRLTSSDDQLLPQMTRIEEALENWKIKLNAALAKSRITSRVSSLDSLLPECVQNNDKIGSSMNISCWINYLKTTFEKMKDDLLKEGFVLVNSELELEGKTFLIDKHCNDVIFFPHDQLEYLESLAIVKKKSLVIQDKSSSIGAHSVRCLISDEDDLIHVNVGAGITTAHLASLTNNYSSNIYGFGAETENQQKQCLRNLERFGVKGNRVKLFSEKFLDIDHNDPRFKDIKVVLVTAICTRSGVPNPVNFIVSEGEDYDFSSYASILCDLAAGHVDGNKVADLVSKNMATLKHALQFPRVQTVVYCTRSVYESENEAAVNASIDCVNTIQQLSKNPYRLSPPVLPLSDLEIESENPLSGKFLKYPPSKLTSGCFIATISREADDPKEAAKGILARAAARGIITGLPAVAETQARTKAPLPTDEARGNSKGTKSSSVASRPTSVGFLSRHSSNTALRDSPCRAWPDSLGSEVLDLRAGATLKGKFTGKRKRHLRLKKTELDLINRLYTKNVDSLKSTKSPSHGITIKHPHPFR